MSHIEIVSPADLSLRDLEAWRAFQESVPAFHNPLLGPDFAQLVGHQRRDLAIAVQRRRRSALAFFPHHRRPGQTVRPVGAPFSDVHAIVSEPGLALEGPRFLARAGVRRLAFSGLADPHGLFGAVPTTAQASFLIDLDHGAEAWLDGLRQAHPKRVKKLKRHRERLESELGPLSLIAPDLDIFALDQLLAWKSRQLRDSGLHDVLAAAWPRRFLAAVANARSGRLHGLMLTLRAGPRVLAGRFGVAADGSSTPGSPPTTRRWPNTAPAP